MYIDCYWYIEKTENDLSPDFPKLNPDPAGHLIIANTHQPFQYKNEVLPAAGKGNHLILPNSKIITVNYSQPFRIIGIKFLVGALYALKNAEQQNLVDKILPFDVIRDFLDERFETYLPNINVDKHSELVRGILKLHPRIRTSKFGNEHGFSQRTIERSFLKETGLTLKQYFTMNRLEFLLHRMHTLDEKDIRWADIAQNFGFSDQPHFFLYLKHSIGNTPGEYVKNRNLTIDAYDNFE